MNNQFNINNMIDNISIIQNISYVVASILSHIHFSEITVRMS